MGQHRQNGRTRPKKRANEKENRGFNRRPDEREKGAFKRRSDEKEKGAFDRRSGEKEKGAFDRRFDARENDETFAPEEDAFVIEGRNAVLEALNAGRKIDRLYMLDGELSGPLVTILGKCKAQGSVIVRCERKKLDSMSRTGAHQGVIARAAVCEYAEIDDVLELAQRRGEKPLIIVCDHIEDEGNLGAIIRSAEVAGAHGIILPKRRGAAVTPTVVKASAGAVMHLPVLLCANVVSTLEALKQKGVWIFGADADGTVELYKADFKGAAALVIGGEGKGLSRLTRERCDFLVSIPMFGRINSLNASNAAAVLLYEAVRQRRFA
jgi:23S rRNA (guanosine2251-2'-O)-methyltransferase